MSETALFPLQSVLFPGGLLELKIFEARYLDLMTRCMREGSAFGVVALTSGTEARSSDDPVSFHDVGTFAELIDVDAAQAGILLVRCRGASRFALLGSRQQGDGLWLGDTTSIADDAHVPPAGRHAALVTSLREAIATLAAQGAHPFLEPLRFDDAGWVANRWCEVLPLPVEAKHRMLTIVEPLARLDVIESLMQVRHAND